jgi:imidazole glycerol phosphate synthase subunit HisF
MAYKRLVGVLAVRDGQVVKSYGYDFWRPAGRLCTALKNLDRWQVDEILVLDISRRDGVNDDVIREIRTARISTPLAYGGGIRKPEDVNPLLTAGCERFVLETMLFQYPDRIKELADKVGAQALIASLPVVAANGGGWKIAPANFSLRVNQRAEPCMEEICEICNALPVAEVLAIDRENEGNSGKFSLMNSAGAHPFHNLTKGIIWFGGIAPTQAVGLLESPSTVAVGFGNRNFESEVAMRWLRRFTLRSRSREMARTTYGA